jgi:hypothetical protein
MRFAQLIQGEKSAKQNNFYKKLSIILILLLIAATSFIAASMLIQPNTALGTPQPVSSTTSLFPVNHEVHVNNNQTTNIIIDITGNSLPADAYFTVNTTSMGSDVPIDAGAPLVIKGTSVVSYYDVKVFANITVTPDVIVKITITNPSFNQYSTMYYWNTTQAKWIALSTEFQSPHTVVGYMAAIDLTGTPIVVTNNNSSTSNPQTDSNPTPTPAQTSTPTSSNQSNTPFTAPEYSWGALLALSICFAAFAFFKVHRKYSNKTTLTPVKI